MDENLESKDENMKKKMKHSSIVHFRNFKALQFP